MPSALQKTRHSFGVLIVLLGIILRTQVVNPMSRIPQECADIGHDMSCAGCKQVQSRRSDNAEFGKPKRGRFFGFLKNRSLCSALSVTRQNSQVPATSIYSDF